MGIYKMTVLGVSDNSGAKKVRCIGMKSKKTSVVGDIIKVSVIKAEPNSQVKKGDVYDAVIVSTRSAINKKNGAWLRYSTNSVVLLNQKLQSIGTRVLGPVDKSCRSVDPLITSRAEEVY